MEQRRGGRHRAKRQRHWARALVLVFALGCAATAATLAIVASDPRLLRGAALAGLLAAFVPTLLPSLERQAVPALDDELHRLRLELARLRGELDAYLAAPPAVPAQRPATLTLPLIRAALAASPETVGPTGWPELAPTTRSSNGHANGNGHANVAAIDLTGERAVTLP